MADNVAAEVRSAIMRRIRSKDTLPELLVRRMLHSQGYRYRVHTRDLPGSPDIVFRARNKAIFVHGCFWHGHDGCRRAFAPKTRAEFWRDKLDRNRARDVRCIAALETAGWQVRVVWECEVADAVRLRAQLSAFLGPPRKEPS